MHIHLFPYMNDNYGVLLHCPDTGQTAAIDAGDCAAYLNVAEHTGWNITQIWVTHHHGDHVAGLGELAQTTNAIIFAPHRIASTIDGAKTCVDGDKIAFAGTDVEVIATPGHTLDMLNYHVPSQRVLFSGDTLFTLGSGRLFEGTPEMMWASLSKLMALPDETMVYGSHEYSVANAAFAVTVDPDNTLLKDRQIEILAARDRGEPTVPSPLAIEKKTNPFLRASDTSIRAHLGMQPASDAEVFAEIRSRKNAF